LVLFQKVPFQDKNHLLKTVQAFSKEHLLAVWLEEVLNAYSVQHNPMGLEDDFMIELRSKINDSKEIINEPYDILSAIYRFDHVCNQLAFQWDGRTHMEVYDAAWKAMYLRWAQQLSLVKEVQRPIVKYAITGGNANTDFLKALIRKGILNFFNIRMKSQTLYRISA